MLEQFRYPEFGASQGLYGKQLTTDRSPSGACCVSKSLALNSRLCLKSYATERRAHYSWVHIFLSLSWDPMQTVRPISFAVLSQDIPADIFSDYLSSAVQVCISLYHVIADNIRNPAQYPLAW